ncbi:hypothetical protein [Calothrix sp. CCY 0018]|uniref:hypothetical protein n=1 Tax=Calothrix sp. CCY 0018 TaxID=3103864 RepID=UPI0039C5CA4F
MIFFNHKLAAVSSFVSISAINIFFPQPALSAISCEASTINRHANGSLQYCVLARDTKITISNYRTGRSTFPCKAQKYIMFAEKSEFQTCTLSEDIKIIENNSVRTCPKDYIVSVSTSNDGKDLSIRCSRY